jgi:dynactin complex subunit
MNKSKDVSEVADILSAVEKWWDVYDVIKERYDNDVTFVSALQRFFNIVPSSMTYEEYLASQSSDVIATEMYAK